MKLEWNEVSDSDLEVYRIPIRNWNEDKSSKSSGDGKGFIEYL